MTARPTIDRIVRSQRKTVALIVTPEGQLEVRAPRQITRRQIDAIVAEKSLWIEKQQERARISQEKAKPRPLADGARLWFLGKGYPLCLTEDGPARAHLIHGFNLPRSALPNADRHLIAWYRQQARKIISGRVAYFSELHRLTYRAIRITSARARWGSCSSQNTLSFPWRLVMAPMEVIDYIVVHELAHTIVKNHSQAFWNLVGSMLPEFKIQRKWLKLNGRLLDLSVEAAEANVLTVTK